jgi:hypothetical protein
VNLCAPLASGPVDVATNPNGSYSNLAATSPEESVTILASLGRVDLWADLLSKPDSRLHRKHTTASSGCEVH